MKRCGAARLRLTCPATPARFPRRSAPLRQGAGWARAQLLGRDDAVLEDPVAEEGDRRVQDSIRGDGQAPAGAHVVDRLPGFDEIDRPVELLPGHRLSGPAQDTQDVLRNV